MAKNLLIEKTSSIRCRRHFALHQKMAKKNCFIAKILFLFPKKAQEHIRLINLDY